MAGCSSTPRAAAQQPDAAGTPAAACTDGGCATGGLFGGAVALSWCLLLSCIVHPACQGTACLAAGAARRLPSLSPASRIFHLLPFLVNLQAVAAIRRLASPACPDFDPSLLPALCQAAAASKLPEVHKEALGAAVQVLIGRQGSGSSATLPSGQEAALLQAHVQAINACLKAAASAQAAPAAAGAAGSGAAVLLSELTAAVKLAAQRIKQLGWSAFAGEDGGAAMRALCAIAHNQLLAALHSGAHEHAVALATALVPLLPLVDRHLPHGEVTGAEGQAKVGRQQTAAVAVGFVKLLLFIPITAVCHRVCCLAHHFRPTLSTVHIVHALQVLLLAAQALLDVHQKDPAR